MGEDFSRRRALEEESSLCAWYPRIRAFLPTPKTVILDLTDPEIWSLVEVLDGVPPAPTLVAKIRDAAREIGYPLFLRSDQGSGKHEWKDTCYVPSEEALLPHVVNLVAWHELTGLLGIPWHSLVFREFLNLDAPFTAFMGMPVARERRYFVRDGVVECAHPYWPEPAIRESYGFTPLPEDWKAQLARLNTVDDAEVAELTLMAETFGQRNPGYWSVDFARTRDGRWILIDAARGEVSYHWEGCPHNPHPPMPNHEPGGITLEEEP